MCLEVVVPERIAQVGSHQRRESVAARKFEGGRWWVIVCGGGSHVGLCVRRWCSVLCWGFLSVVSMEWTWCSGPALCMLMLWMVVVGYMPDQVVVDVI